MGVKVGELRKSGEYPDFKAWLADKEKNLYVGRRGRIFITDSATGKKTIFHYPGSKWENPFSLKEGTREEVCAKFRAILLDGSLKDRSDGKPLRDKLGELAGLRLGCWCKPQACHADVLVECANAHLGLGVGSQRCADPQEQ